MFKGRNILSFLIKILVLRFTVYKSIPYMRSNLHLMTDKMFYYYSSKELK